MDPSLFTDPLEQNCHAELSACRDVISTVLCQRREQKYTNEKNILLKEEQYASGLTCTFLPDRWQPHLLYILVF